MRPAVSAEFLNLPGAERSDMIKPAAPNPAMLSFECQLAFLPPYDWSAMLLFLKTRGGAGIELVENNRYYRTVAIEDVSGWLSVEMNEEDSNLTVTLSPSLLPKVVQVQAGLNRLFDLHANPLVIEKTLGAIASKHPGLRVPGAFAPFEIAIRAILGQVISVNAATNLAGKLASKYGGEIITPISSLNRLSPQPETLAAANEGDLKALGIMPAQARTIIEFSKEYLNGEISLIPGSSYEATVKALTALKGIGQWTADYIAMRCIADPDVFLHGDLGVKKALGETNKKVLIELAEKYRPWRA